MKLIPLSLMALAVTSAGAATVPKLSVSLTQEPVVMRLNKDEFRIVFGINGEKCAPVGCSGTIHYRVDWRTAEGANRWSEVKELRYAISPLASRTISVDRQYFDTGEGQHTTDVVKVTVNKITCVGATTGRVAQIAPTAE
jgi:hypothetical protein